MGEFEVTGKGHSELVEEVFVVHNSESIVIMEETCDSDVREAGLSD